MTTKLYILSNGKKSKIGISKNTTTRFSNYRTHNPDTDIHFVYTFNGEEEAHIIESKIKGLLIEKSVNNFSEWFNLSVIELKNEVDKLINQLNIKATTEDIKKSKTKIQLSNECFDILINKLSEVEQKLLHRIINLSDLDGNFSIKQEILATDMEISTRTVIRAIKTLTNHRLLLVSKNGTSNNYKVNSNLIQKIIKIQ